MNETKLNYEVIMSKIIHTNYSDKSLRVQAAYRVAENWRIQKRLPRITKLAINLGIIKKY